MIVTVTNHNYHTMGTTCKIYNTKIKISDIVWININIAKFRLLTQDVVAMVTRLHYGATRFLNFGVHILKIDNISFHIV